MSTYTTKPIPELEDRLFSTEVNKVIQRLNQTVLIGSPIEPCEQAVGKNSFPISVSAIFQTLLFKLFLWTMSFRQSEPSNTTSLKVTISLPSPVGGLEISNWKEIAFYLPS